MAPIRIAPPPEPDRPETASHAWIYCGRASDGRVKVGITLDPDRRRRQIERASGLRFKAWEQRWCYAPGAAERYLLARWADYRLDGEWLRAPGLFEEIIDYMLPRTAAEPPEAHGLVEIHPAICEALPEPPARRCCRVTCRAA
jgi:hypothetical protein